MNKQYHIFFLIALIIVFTLSAITELLLGEVPLNFLQIKELWQENTIANTLIIHHRLPRMLNAIAVGSGLALAGYIMQLVFKNPLAGPYVLGISSGAGLLVAFYIMSGITGWALSFGLPLVAVSGAFLVTVLLLLLMKRIKSIATILIVGVLIGSVSTAIISILQFFSNKNQLKSFVVWTMGTLENTTLHTALILFIIVLAIYFILKFFTKNINLLLLPETKAATLGANIVKTRLYLLLAASVITGISVAFSGPIGFVGIVAPHLTAMVVQSRLFQKTLLTLFFMGADFVLISDILAHLPDNIILPVNAILAIFGVPVIFYIILTKKQIVW